MAAPSPLLVLVTMFAADPAGGIRAFHLDPAAGTLVPVVHTSGCPHAFFLALAPDRRTVYSLTAGEFGAADTEEVVAWRLAGREGRLEPLGRRPAGGAAACFVAPDPTGRTLLLAHYTGGTVATLPPHHRGESKTADVKFTPDGRFLYGTNRGHDSIAVCRVADDGTLAIVEIVPSRGRGPQNLAITPDGSLLLCANMAGDSLAVFRIHPDTGRLSPVGEPVPVASPSCIALMP